MSAKRITNMAASVRQRLLDRARQRNEDYNFVLMRYALERLLYRLSKSPHSPDFVLKGALLFQIWSDQPYRPTKDLDLLGHGDFSVSRHEQIFRDVCRESVEEDGLHFDPHSVRGEEIKEEQGYGGLRMRIRAQLGGADLGLQIDIGFGDAVTPKAEDVQYPTMLDHPAPRVRAYPKESVISEKFQAMVSLGIGSSRMKDLYDVWMMSRMFDFDGALLAAAIRATFERRRTELPVEPPVALSPDFYRDAGKQAQWRAFLERLTLPNVAVDLQKAIDEIRDFLMPPTAALVHHEPWTMRWPANGPWTSA